MYDGSMRPVLFLQLDKTLVWLWATQRPCMWRTMQVAERDIGELCRGGVA